MGLHKYLLGLVVFSVVVIFGINMAADINNTYNVSITDQDFNALNNSAANMLIQTDSLAQSQNSLSIGGDIEETPLALGVALYFS